MRRDSEPEAEGLESREIVTILYKPNHRVFQMAFKAELGVAPITKVWNTLSLMGIRITNVTMASTDGKMGNWSVFLDSENFGITARALRSQLEDMQVLYDLRITPGEELVVDQLFFPITDPLGNRVMIITQQAFQQMMHALRTTFGTGEGVVIYQEGVSIGSTYAATIRPMLRGDMKRFFGELAKLYTAMGLGICEFLEINFDRLHFVLKLNKCIECEGQRSETPYSQWMRGMLVGAGSTLLDTPMACRETKCAAIGDPYCEFELFKDEGC